MSMRRRAAQAQMHYADVVGLQADFENNTFTRLAGARGRTPGADFDCFAPFGGRRRCCVADDGTVNAFYGEASYAENGSNGQVMVYQPKFYYRTVPLKLTPLASGIGSALKKAAFYISATPKPGFRLHPAFRDENGNELGHILLSAYEASYYDASQGGIFTDGTDTDAAIDFAADRLCSLAGTKPISGAVKKLSRAAAETLAGARGAGWHIQTIRTCAAEQLLMAVEYGTMNLQTAIGKGVVAIPDTDGLNCASLTGSTSVLGNRSGRAESTVNEIAGTRISFSDADKTAISYRGTENPWGNIWKLINGLNIRGNGTTAGGTVQIADGFDLTGTDEEIYRSAGFTLSNTSGYFNAPGYGTPQDDWLLLPADNGGRAAYPVGDYVFVAADLNGIRISTYGGRWTSGDYAGAFFSTFNTTVGNYGRDLGCRLIHIPQKSL